MKPGSTVRVTYLASPGPHLATRDALVLEAAGDVLAVKVPADPQRPGSRDMTLEGVKRGPGAPDGRGGPTWLPTDEPAPEAEKPPAKGSKRAG